MAMNGFYREGEYWTLAFNGEVARLRASRGLLLLSRLMERPGRELHVLDLADRLAAQRATIRSQVVALTDAGAARDRGGDEPPVCRPWSRAADARRGLECCSARPATGRADSR